MLEPMVRIALDTAGVVYQVMDCDPDLADTQAFCAAYGVDPADSANTILIASKRPEGKMAATLVLATHRLDVNRAVRDAMGVSKVSFADAEQTLQVTGMMLGGVTAFGLPPDLPVLIDQAVMERRIIILGGGNRSSKLKVTPDQLLKIPTATVVSGLANPLEPSPHSSGGR